MADPDLAASNDAPRLRRDLIELLVGYVLILLVLWMPRLWQRPFYIAAVLWIVAVTCVSFDGWNALGLRGANFLRSLWVVGVALVAAALAVALATRLHTLHLPDTPLLFLKGFWGYSIWSLVQQFLLQDFFLLRIRRLVPGRLSAVLVTAGLFALAHLPNPILTPITFVFGILACLLFLRYRNIFTLGIAHAVLGVCIAVTVPGPVIHNMRVGLGYLTYSPHRVHHLNH